MRYRVLIGALASSALVLGACSSGSSESADSAAEESASSTEETAAAAEETATEEEASEAALVGFSYPIEANTYLKAIGLGAQAQLKKVCAADFYPVDAQLDGNKQISDVEAMITKGVDAMIIYPLDSNGLKPALDKASEAGIKVITMNYSVDDSTDAPPSPSLGQVQDAFPQRALAKEKVEWLKTVLPDGGNILYVGLAFPVAALEAHANMFAEELANAPEFNFLGRVDNQTDDSEGGRQAVDEALVRFPEVDAIISYNDPTALGAYQAVSAAGRVGDIKIIGNQMQPEAVESLRNGEIDGSWDFNPVDSGVALADLTCAVLTGAPESDYAKTVQTPAQVYTKESVTDFVSWDDRIANIG